MRLKSTFVALGATIAVLATTPLSAMAQDSDYYERFKAQLEAQKADEAAAPATAADTGTPTTLSDDPDQTLLSTTDYDGPTRGFGNLPKSFTPSEQERVAVPVTFASNSVALTRDARETLTELCSVMARLNGEGAALAGLKVIGHTDAVGSRTYNRVLSKRRANSVAEFLVANDCSLSRDDLKVEGYGEDQLDPQYASNPAAAQHRRVEFVALRSN